MYAGTSQCTSTSACLPGLSSCPKSCKKNARTCKILSFLQLQLLPWQFLLQQCTLLLDPSLFPEHTKKLSRRLVVTYHDSEVLSFFGCFPSFTHSFFSLQSQSLMKTMHSRNVGICSQASCESGLPLVHSNACRPTSSFTLPDRY